MRRIMGLATAAAIAAVASAASAGEWTGTVKEIDQTSKNITVTDADSDRERTFAVSPTNTVGATLEDLKEGDQVKIFFADSDTESGEPINAMQIDRVQE